MPSSSRADSPCLLSFGRYFAPPLLSPHLFFPLSHLRCSIRMCDKSLTPIIPLSSFCSPSSYRFMSIMWLITHTFTSLCLSGSIPRISSVYSAASAVLSMRFREGVQLFSPEDSTNLSSLHLSVLGWHCFTITFC